MSRFGEKSLFPEALLLEVEVYFKSLVIMFSPSGKISFNLSKRIIIMESSGFC